MKHLITDRDLSSGAVGRRIVLDANTLITPAARTVLATESVSMMPTASSSGTPLGRPPRMRASSVGSTLGMSRLSMRLSRPTSRPRRRAEVVSSTEPVNRITNLPGETGRARRICTAASLRSASTVSKPPAMEASSSSAMHGPVPPTWPLPVGPSVRARAS